MSKTQCPRTHISEILASRGITLPSPETIYRGTPIQRRRKLGRAELYRHAAIEALEQHRRRVAERDEPGHVRIGRLIEEIQAISTEALRRAIRSPKARTRAERG